MLVQATMSSRILYKPEVLDGNGSVGVRTGHNTTVLLRNVSEVYISLPIALLGIVGNIVSFIILCHQRRQKLQTITVLLQVSLFITVSRVLIWS